VTTRPDHPTTHDPQPDTEPAPAPQPRPGFAAPGFARTSATPILLIAAALAAAAGLDRHWHLLTLIGAVVPVALLVEWALTTNRAALRGGPIRPAAHLTAIAVLAAGVLVAATGVVVTATSPALLAGILALFGCVR